MITRFTDAVCGVCARSATGFGYAPQTGQSILWVCDDPDCLQVAKDTYTMKQDQFSRLESLAAGKGGEDGGQFLDNIGKTDLATLSPDEWHEFCRRIVAGYRKALVTSLKDETPF
jgi:hypothetical protein